MEVKDYSGQFTRGGTSYGSFAKPVLGGSGNVAEGLSKIGSKTAFVGKIGQDFFGNLYLNDLKEKKIVTKIFRDKHLQTGLILVLVEDGQQRSFLVFRGANDNLSSKEIEKTRNLIKGSTYLYFSGLSLVKDPQRSAIFKAIDLAKKFKTKIVFDPGAFNLVNSEKNLFKELLGQCDIFSPNLEEARAITGANNINEVVYNLRERVPFTALKCDRNGCILITKNKVVKVPGYGTKCVDPTGAGDAFTAGVIYGLSRGLSLQSIGRLANWFAAGLVTRIGPRSFPTKMEIEKFLKRLPSTDGQETNI